MKCPKCGYLGFETSDRCRNCGYDFSLALEVGPASELPLRSAQDLGEPLADFDLSDLATDNPKDPPVALDLDRIIGAAPDATVASASPVRPQSGAPSGQTTGSASSAPRARVAPSAPHASVRRNAPNAPSAPAARSAPSAPAAPGAPDPAPLPLFSETDDTPLITAPRPPRPPLAVRRTTPEIPRTRARSVTPRPDDAEISLLTAVPEEDGGQIPRADTPAQTSTIAPAPAGRRLTAALIDLTLLGTINVVVLYLTLAMTGLSREQMALLPILPIVTFFLILDGGYLVAFIAASGQTIGKMIVGIRVLGDDGRRVDIAGALLRACGCAVSVLTAGVGYLPAFIASDGRALQDRISGTRVVSAR